MDIYDFLNDFNSNYDTAQSSGSSANGKPADAQPAGGSTPSAAPGKGGYPKTRAEAEAMGYKPLTDTAPEVQPCEFGYPCNDCGFCH